MNNTNNELLQQKNDNYQDKKRTCDGLSRTNEQLQSKLDAHHALQDEVVERAPLSRVARADLLVSNARLELARLKAGIDRHRLDKNDPNFETKDLAIFTQVTDACMTQSRERDNIILTGVNHPIPALEASAERREAAYQDNFSMVRSHLDTILRGYDIDDLIEEARQGGSSNSGPQNSSDQGATVSDQASGSGTAQNQGSGSLVEDFADPNLEQPSYTDPED